MGWFGAPAVVLAAIASRTSTIRLSSAVTVLSSDCDALFAEKLDLLLRLRAEARVTWSGRFRPALHDQFSGPLSFT